MSKRVLLAAVVTSDDPEGHSLNELAALAATIDCDPVLRVTQKKSRPDARTVLGKGKIAEIKQLIDEHDIDLVIFDTELSPIQQRNLEAALEGDVSDRTAVILDIFARRAVSTEGKLQVELAQLKYLLPRLAGSGKDMSRLGGGIGTRGPGERKLEVDRRTIRRRIHALEQELGSVHKRRGLNRKKREAADIPVVSLVGYTNAGKSSLMKRLSGRDTLIEDQLFATLDTTSRRVGLPSGGSFVLNDTVGFINKLPHQLIAAFRATLEEVSQAELLLHVVDVSDPLAAERIRTVQQVLDSIGAANRNELLVLNKSDKVNPADSETGLPDLHEGLLVSAVTGDGIEELLNTIEKILYGESITVELTIPHSRGDILSYLYQNAQILKRDELDPGVQVLVRGRSSVLGIAAGQLERG